MFLQPRLQGALLALGLPVFNQMAVAGYIFHEGNLSGEFSLGAGGAYIDTRQVNFGAGRVDLRNGENGGTKIGWQEFYLKPGVTLQYSVEPDLDLLTGLSVLGATTWGDGDAGGSTRSSDGRTGTEEAYAGLRAGDWRVTIGRQNYSIGTGFIVMDGHLDLYDDGAYWLGPRAAFRDSAVLGFTGKELSGQAFSLRTDDHLGDFRMSGINLDYDTGGQVTLGAMAMRVSSLDSALNQATPRDNMRVYNVRALQGKLPGLDNLRLQGEYAIEKGHDGDLKYDASAWYAQADYTFAALPLQPMLSYRHARFSGDDDPTDHTRKSWDPLSKGFVDWGTWLVGDIVGNYLLFNSNERVDQWSLRTQVTPTVALGTVHYEFSLDEKVFNGLPVGDRRFANEDVVYLEWTPTSSFYSALSYNWAKPLSAAHELYGNDNFQALEMYFTYRY